MLKLSPTLSIAPKHVSVMLIFAHLAASSLCVLQLLPRRLIAMHANYQAIIRVSQAALLNHQKASCIYNHSVYLLKIAH
jgi:hypothetical protein